MSEEYNGCTNYATWVINNHSSGYWIQMARELGDKYILADYMKDYYNAENPLQDTAGEFSDLLQYAINIIDWDDLAGTYMHDAMQEVIDEVRDGM